jgi:hypothetical protein
MLAGLVAGAAHAARQRWTRRLAGACGRLLAAAWPGLFWLCVVNACSWWVGSFVVGGALELAAPDLFVHSLFLAVLSMPLATVADIAHRVRHGSDADHPIPTPLTW